MEDLLKDNVTRYQRIMIIVNANEIFNEEQKPGFSFIRTAFIMLKFCCW